MYPVSRSDGANAVSTTEAAVVIGWGYLIII
jgi:hypothetical protein